MELRSQCTIQRSEALTQSLYGQHWMAHMLLQYRRLKLEVACHNNLVHSLLSKYNIPNLFGK
jgi:hypothetical protein